MKAKRSGRRGLASLWAVAVLSVLTVVLAGVTAQLLSNRKILDHRQHELQALWLARSGLELASQRLLSNPKEYESEQVELLPRSQVKIKVSKGEKADQYVVASEASYPLDRKDKIVLTLTRRFQRIADKDQTRLTVLLEPEKR